MVLEGVPVGEQTVEPSIQGESNAMSAPHTRICSTIACALLFVGCVPEQREESDSRHPSPPSIAMADTPAVVFGGGRDSTVYDLGRTIDVDFLSDGRLAVLCCDNQILIYSPEGSHSATFGGRGDAPGQFRAARMIVLPGDTLLVYDAISKRATWLEPNTGVARSLTYLSDIPMGFTTPLGVSASGEVLLSSIHTLPRTELPALNDTTRSLAEVIAVLPSGARRLLLRVPDVLVVTRRPPVGAPDARLLDNVRYGGSASIQITGDTLMLLAGGSRQVELRRVWDDTATIGRFEIPVARAAVSAQDRAAFIAAETAPLRERALGGHPPPVDPEAVLNFLESAAFADSFPPIVRLLLDKRTGTLWAIHGGPREADGWQATQVDQRGVVLGRLEGTLPGSKPLAFNGTRVLVGRLQEDGVTTFELRSLLRGAPD